MQNEKYAIYCFSLEKTKFAPVKYDRNSKQTLQDLLFLGAWVHQLESEQGQLPENLSPPPEDFKPKLLSYYDFSEIGRENFIENIDVNILVVLMPDFNDDIKLLEMILGQKYDSHIRTSNITVKTPTEDVVELKPNFYGIGVNLKALWKKLRS